ncbi:MAG TPA: inositol monophosphatase family protein [Dermatophilaceae bacterium]|nr:inositol monophosphatase family protein [Dermatophilaceae bacterium]
MTPIPDTTGHLPVPSIDDLSVLEALALTLAHETGQLVHEGRPADLANTTGTKTSDTDPVTVMDTRAEEHLRRRLRAARPDDGLQGEEGSSIPSRSGLTWVVDPIDGTTNYLYDLPLYAVSVAVVVGDPTTPGAWRPVAGAVRAPALDITWSARAGGGAWRRGPARPWDVAGPGGEPPAVPARVGRQSHLGPALVGTGFGYQPERRAQQAEVLTRVLPAVRDLRRMGSAAIDLCLVGDGRLDGFFEVGLNPWDLAAGWLVVTEAGGSVSGVGGGAPGVDLVVAANPALHPRLLALLESPA